MTNTDVRNLLQDLTSFADPKGSLENPRILKTLVLILSDRVSYPQFLHYISEQAIQFINLKKFDLQMCFHCLEPPMDQLFKILKRLS